MMRREAGYVFFDLPLAEADLLCTLPREFGGSDAFPHVEGDRIRFQYSEMEFAVLLLALGSCAGGAETAERRNAWVRLANSINEGNPNYTPYAVDEPLKD